MRSITAISLLASGNQISLRGTNELRRYWRESKDPVCCTALRLAIPHRYHYASNRLNWTRTYPGWYFWLELITARAGLDFMFALIRVALHAVLRAGSLGVITSSAAYLVDSPPLGGPS